MKSSALGLSLVTPTISVANFPVADLVQAVPTVANATIFRELPFAVNGFFLHPVNDLDGSGGSGRATLYAGSLSTGVGLAYKQATITGTGAAGAVFNGNTANDTVSFPQSRTIGFNPTEGAQPDGARSLDIGSTVLLSQPVMRNGTTWLAHSADETGDGLVDIFWTQLAADGSVLQSGVISDPQRNLIFPSISLNEAGDVLVTTATTSATEYPGSMAYIGRMVGGVTSFGSMTGLVLYEGTQSHQLINANNRNRWGGLEHDGAGSAGFEPVLDLPAGGGAGDGQHVLVELGRAGDLDRGAGGVWRNGWSGCGGSWAGVGLLPSRSGCGLNVGWPGCRIRGDAAGDPPPRHGRVLRLRGAARSSGVEGEAGDRGGAGGSTWGGVRGEL